MQKDMGLQLTGHKYKYSCRLDKAVETDKDYIEELEMRFEEAADVWHLTCYQIYGPGAVSYTHLTLPTKRIV